MKRTILKRSILLILGLSAILLAVLVGHLSRSLPN